VSSSSARIPAYLAAAAAALLLATVPASAGFTTNIEYLDPNGARVAVTGTDTMFTFDRRTIFRKPMGPEEKKYEDVEVRIDSFSFRGSRITFQKIHEVRFERREEAGREYLAIEFNMTTGETIQRRGSDLDGAEHPISPSISFSTPEGPVSIPIDPLTSPAGRKGHATLLRIEFPNNPDRRPPPRRRAKD